VLLAALPAACTASRVTAPSPKPEAHATAASPVVTAWTTSADHRLALARQTLPFDAATAAVAVADISIDPAARRQQIVGFGAAITDASAWVLQHDMTAAQREPLMRELFSREGDGIGLGFTRLTIGASDFSRRHYSLDDSPAGRPDPQLRYFSIAPNLDDVVPVTRQALAINPELQVMASPWSAPGWMKDSGSLVKGSLRDDAVDAFARYLVRYVDAYAAQGIPIFALTVQNEPAFEPEDYPGMRLQARQRIRIVRALGPLLAARANPVSILEWDHNWDKPEEPTAVLSDPQANRYIAGVAWHCYGGDVSAQDQVHDAFPDKDAWLTECSGGDWEPVKSGGLSGQVRTLIVDTTRHWARGVLFWNLALDEHGGPHSGGCATCRGLVTVQSSNGAVTRTDDYYALAHASRFVLRDAYRIDSTSPGNGLDDVAFRNPDGSLVLIVANSGRTARSFVAQAQGKRFHAALEPGSVATYVWRSDR
jgi:glucosylceramidase